MDHPLRRPEQILAYRPLKQILAAKPRVLWSVGPGNNALSAMHLMADKNIGLLVVLEQRAIVGVVSERDCVRRLVLAGKSPEATPVADIMIRNVISVDVAKTFADCLKLMHAHRIRHLPVVDNDTPVTVISIRDLLAEALAHHAKIIDELERERMTMLTSMA
jgi:signal-transduction protein with cAMP-binding, CBS, and nucleotidyltransferase domain